LETVPSDTLSSQGCQSEASERDAVPALVTGTQVVLRRSSQRGTPRLQNAKVCPGHVTSTGQRGQYASGQKMQQVLHHPAKNFKLSNLKFTPGDGAPAASKSILKTVSLSLFLFVFLRLCLSLSSSLPLFVSQCCHLLPFPLSLLLDGCVCNSHVFLTHVFVCV
jgi:hypothetical protein